MNANEKVFYDALMKKYGSDISVAEFRRPHHAMIHQILGSMNADRLQSLSCFFVATPPSPC